MVWKNENTEVIVTQVCPKDSLKKAVTKQTIYKKDSVSLGDGIFRFGDQRIDVGSITLVKKRWIVTVLSQSRLFIQVDCNDGQTYYIIVGGQRRMFNNETHDLYNRLLAEKSQGELALDSEYTSIDDGLRRGVIAFSLILIFLNLVSIPFFNAFNMSGAGFLGIGGMLVLWSVNFFVDMRYEEPEYKDAKKKKGIITLVITVVIFIASLVLASILLSILMN